jgi:hypothetical protein
MEEAMNSAPATVAIPGTYDEIFVVRFAGRRIAEIWGVVDVLSQMKQLGMVAA